jgi:CubicO group peptidase (beta-lactamase class C family)
MSHHHATRRASARRALGAPQRSFAPLLVGAAALCALSHGCADSEDSPLDAAASRPEAGAMDPGIEPGRTSDGGTPEGRDGAATPPPSAVDAGAAGMSDAAPPGAPAITACSGVPLPARALRPSPGAPASLAPYDPTGGYRSARPEEAGFDAAKLAAALAHTTPTSRTEGLIVLRKGYVVAETYVAPFTRDAVHESFSMAKSFSSTLVGIALDQKLLASTDARICTYYPETWRCDASDDPRSRITVAHAMNVSTGLSWAEDWRGGLVTVNDSVIGLALGMLDYTLGRTAAEEPGLRQRYSSGDPSLLSGVLQGVTGGTAAAFAERVLFGPLGISGAAWNADSKGRTQTFAGLKLPLREFAKLGLLYAQRGRWAGQQLLSEAWVDRVTRVEDPCSDVYQWLFHVNIPARLGEVGSPCTDYPFCTHTSFANLPADGFFASGLQGQYVFVFPSAELVVARVATDSGGSEDWVRYSRTLLEGIFDAMVP